MLKQKMPASRAWRISAGVLPTPEKTTFFGSAPAARTRCNRRRRCRNRTHAGKEVEDCEVRIGLHGIADQGTLPGRMDRQYIQKFLQRTFQRGAGIDVGGRAELFGNGGQGDVFGVQDTVFRSKGGHSGCAEGVGVSVLTSGRFAGLGVGLALPSQGSGAGPGGSTKGPFRPQAQIQQGDGNSGHGDGLVSKKKGW